METKRQKRKVILIPTEKGENCIIARAIRGSHDILSYAKHNEYLTQSYLNTKNSVAKHLYILDEQTTKGKYILFQDTFKTCIYKVDSYKNGRFICGNIEVLEEYASIIIASTDKSLGYNPFGGQDILTIPQPSDEFIKVYIKEYNKGNQIEYIDVEYEHKIRIKADNNCETYRPCPDFYNTKEQYDKAVIDLNRRTRMVKTVSNVLHYNDYILKVDNHNKITIRELKNSWTKEEVEILCNTAYEYAGANCFGSDKHSFKQFKRDHL